MQLFKNRIPRDSVFFSAEPYELPFLLNQNRTKKEEVTDEKSEYEIHLELRHRELLTEQQAIEKEKVKIEKMKQSIASEKEQLEKEKLQHKQELEIRRHEIEKEKVKMYYEICEFIWDQSIEVAEKIIHQAISTEQISIIPLLEGTIRQLPISFDKLRIIVHPLTVEKLKDEHEGTKIHWLLDNLEWKYDLSLRVGEFIIEEEKEFFEYKFQNIFQMLRKKLHDRKYVQEKSESVKWGGRL